MSGEIKILFYIIVGIIYIISTFYNKEKKKQNQRDVAKKPVDTKTAEDIFRELRKSLSIPEEIVKEIKPAENTPKRKLSNKPEPLSRKQNPDPKPVQPVENTFIKEAHFEHHKETEIQDFKESADDKPEIDFSDMDSRKALIFGEIFKRPQY